ncbi:MAG: hypothetical protein AAFN93_06245 [Bacteroidota bacterium]
MIVYSVVTNGEVEVMITYWVDEKNIIVRTSHLWDSFAEDNEGGARSFSEDILGKNLFSFISGDTTKMFIETIIVRSRQLQSPLNIDYRCDSPDMKRYMTMKLTLEDDETLRIDNILQREESMSGSVHFSADDCNSQIIRCSLCQKVLTENDWIEPELLIRENTAKTVLVNYSVCEDCQTYFNDMLQAEDDDKKRPVHNV